MAYMIGYFGKEFVQIRFLVTIRWPIYGPNHIHPHQKAQLVAGLFTIFILVRAGGLEPLTFRTGT